MKSEINTEKILTYINEKKLSKKDFCRLCDISQYVLNKILCRQRCRFVVPMLKIARMMGVELRDLYV
ncbi:MAG: hypothetical protein IKC47_03395 [Clostridia bacterium]|nr:hypothetical protein [Clostridia bacterium]